jgi:hypothetical protein
MLTPFKNWMCCWSTLPIAQIHTNSHAYLMTESDNHIVNKVEDPGDVFEHSRFKVKSAYLPKHSHTHTYSYTYT